jgi:hypothetical protein
MKRKTCIALLALSSGLMIVFAADIDKCTEKFDGCKVTCGNMKAQCMARGNNVESCNFRLKQCTEGCDKDLKACQAKTKK